MISEYEHSKRQTNIMVCVTNQKSCDRLIARGVERGGGAEEAQLHVVHCVHTSRNFMGSPFEGDAIEYLFTAAQLAGAELTLLRAPDVEDALIDYAQKHAITIMILGASGPAADPDNIIARLQRRLPEVEFDIVG
ncbi:MAG: universal stress protein UspA [Candidatus Pelethousia sp.]|nr:universal stress protein UspA [Candidatus Pelethousia sp.]